MDDQILQFIPPKYLGLAVSVLALLRTLDGLARLIPDSWLPGHTFFEAIVLGARKAGSALFKKSDQDPPAPPPGTVLRGGGAALALLFVSSLLACGHNPKVIAATTTIATVQTVDAGVDYFRAHVTDWEVAIANDAVAKCKGEREIDAYKACTAGVTAPRRQPIDRVKNAIHAYKLAVAAGLQLDPLIAELTSALAGMGVHVGGAQ